LWVQASVLHFFRNVCCVLAEFGNRYIAVGNEHASGLHCSLKRTQLAHVGCDRHECNISFVAKHRHTYYLHATTLCGFYRRNNGLAVKLCCRMTKKVQHGHSNRGRGGHWFAHVARLPFVCCCCVGERQCRTCWRLIIKVQEQRWFSEFEFHQFGDSFSVHHHVYAGIQR